MFGGRPLFARWTPGRGLPLLPPGHHFPEKPRSDMIVTMLLGDGPPPFRQLWEGELPAVPDAGEPLSFNGRIYRVVERSWRFGTAPTATETALGPMNGPATVQIAVGLMLTQIGGPSHVALVR